jgi:hypothetical protein
MGDELTGGLKVLLSPEKMRVCPAMKAMGCLFTHWGCSTGPDYSETD